MFIALLLHSLFLFKENLTPMNYLMVEQNNIYDCTTFEAELWSCYFVALWSD